VRIEQIPALGLDPTDAIGHRGLIDALRNEVLAKGDHRLAETDRAALGERTHLGTHEGGIAAGAFEQETLEI